MPIDEAQLSRVREDLGRVGVWIGVLRQAPAQAVRAAAARIEALGYPSLWTGEVLGGREAFALQSLLLASTEGLVTGTGIANLWARHPATMEAGAATLGEAYPGRFVLGVGVSHARIVAAKGGTYEFPLAKMREYLDGMDEAAGGAPKADPPVPRLLAALGPRMLELSRDRADGAHSYFVPVEHTALAREALGNDRLLVPEQAVVLETDPERARRTAREHVANYLALPNYVNNLHRLGFDEEDTTGAGTDRLVDAVVAWGDPAAVAARVGEHLDAGADAVLIQPLGPLESALHQLEQLAPSLLGH